MKKRFKKSNKFFERSIKVIPTASQTFSKSSMNLVKGASPLFMNYAKGAEIFDLDGNKYIDYMLSLLPIILGYQDKHTDSAIKNQLKKGIIYSLASPLETELAEILIKIIPSAEMVRFAKNGSDVTSGAIRLARAYTGRDKIALFGYHGWHDWYIGTTTRNLGVPKSVSNLSTKLPFNDFDAIDLFLKSNPEKYAAIILEPESTLTPVKDYLEKLREISTKYGIVLIFDEICSCFRSHIGGSQTKYKVIPDLTCLGKSMGNGMPISALAGKKKIMRYMDKIFFSGTFGGENLSLPAAIATIKKLKKHKIPQLMNKKGRELKFLINQIIRENSLDNIINISGPDWWPKIDIKPYKKINQNLIASIVRQELISQGVLASATLNLSYSHCTKKQITKKTIKAFEHSLIFLSEALSKPHPEKVLRGKQIESIFKVRN